jgi:hypothetical protein
VVLVGEGGQKVIQLVEFGSDGPHLSSGIGSGFPLLVNNTPDIAGLVGI